MAIKPIEKEQEFKTCLLDRMCYIVIIIFLMLNDLFAINL